METLLRKGSPLRQRSHVIIIVLGAEGGEAVKYLPERSRLSPIRSIRLLFWTIDEDMRLDRRFMDRSSLYR